MSALQAFASRVGDPQTRDELQKLFKQVESSLGAGSVAAVTGIYNTPRLYRFLLANRIDAHDATSQVVLNSNARAELGMDAKRDEIVSSNLGFGTLPRAAEFRRYVPSNPFLGRAKDGRVVDYHCLGSSADFDGMRNAFSEKVGDFC